MTTENFLEILKNIKTIDEAKKLKDDIIASDNVLEFINYLRYIQYNDEDADFETINKINKFLAFKELTTIENENEHLNFGDSVEIVEKEEIVEDNSFKINVIAKSRSMFTNDGSKKLKIKAALQDHFETILIVKENETLSKYGFITKDGTNYIYKLDNEHEDFLSEVVDVDVDTVVSLFALKTVKGNVSKTFKKIDLELIDLEVDYFLTKKTNKGVLSLVSGGVIMTLASETVLTYNEDDYKEDEPETPEQGQGLGMPDLSGMPKKLMDTLKKSGAKIMGVGTGGGSMDLSGNVSGNIKELSDDELDDMVNDENTFKLDSLDDVLNDPDAGLTSDEAKEILSDLGLTVDEAKDLIQYPEDEIDYEKMKDDLPWNDEEWSFELKDGLILKAGYGLVEGEFALETWDKMIRELDKMNKLPENEFKPIDGYYSLDHAYFGDYDEATERFDVHPDEDSFILIPKDEIVKTWCDEESDNNPGFTLKTTTFDDVLDDELEEDELFSCDEPTDIVVAGTCFDDGGRDFAITDDYSSFGLSVNKTTVKGLGYLDCDGFVNILTLTDFIEKVKNNRIGYYGMSTSELFESGSDFAIIKNYVGKIKLAVKVSDTENKKDENTWISTSKLTDEYIQHDKYLRKFGDEVYAEVFVDFDNEIDASKLDKKLYKKLKKSYIRGKKVDNIVDNNNNNNNNNNNISTDISDYDGNEIKFLIPNESIMDNYDEEYSFKTYNEIFNDLINEDIFDINYAKTLTKLNIILYYVNELTDYDIFTLKTKIFINNKEVENSKEILSLPIDSDITIKFKD